MQRCYVSFREKQWAFQFTLTNRFKDDLSKYLNTAEAHTRSIKPVMLLFAVVTYEGLRQLRWKNRSEISFFFYKRIPQKVILKDSFF
jgi:hypothetical protein